MAYAGTPSSPATEALIPEHKGVSARKKTVIATVAAVVAVLIGLGAFLLFNGGPGNGIVTGTIELTNPGAIAPKLLAGQLMVEFAKPGRIETYKTIRTVSVGASGHFRVSLPPGDYDLEGSGTYLVGGQSEQSSTGIEVTVRSGKTTYIPFQIPVSGLSPTT